MELYYIYLIIVALTSALLIIIYSITLWHNLKGSNFKFINNIVIILILGNICFFTVAFTQYEINVRNQIKSVYVWLLAICNGGSDLALCLSHILLAYKFRKIALGGPLNDDTIEMNRNSQNRGKIAYCILISLNILFPAAEIVAYVFYDISYFLKGEESKLISKIISAASFSVYIIEIVSGVLLMNVVRSMIKTIRKDKENQINIPTLLVHSGAFGLYLVSLLILFATQVPFLLNPGN